MCQVCQGGHAAEACPAVAEIEYFEDGTIKRIVKVAPTSRNGSWILDNYGTKITYSGTPGFTLNTSGNSFTDCRVQRPVDPDLPPA